MHASVGVAVCRGVPGINNVMIGAVPALCARTAPVGVGSWPGAPPPPPHVKPLVKSSFWELGTASRRRSSSSRHPVRIPHPLGVPCPWGGRPVRCTRCPGALDWDQDGHFVLC